MWHVVTGLMIIDKQTEGNHTKVRFIKTSLVGLSYNINCIYCI